MGAFKLANEFAERRREHRAQSARQLLLIQLPLGQVIPSHLVDTSPHGFCIVHQYEGFFPGQYARILHTWGEVSCRVVWVGVREDDIVTGFRTD